MPPRSAPVASRIRLLAAAALLGLCAIEVAYGLAFAPALATVALDGPAPVPGAPLVRSGIAAVVFVGLSVAGSALTALAALGIASGARAGWWLGIVGAALWVPTGCAPLALAAAGVLLLPDVRRVAFPSPPPPPSAPPPDPVADPYG